MPERATPPIVRPVPRAAPETGDTKARILDAAEWLYLEGGAAAMSLRGVTERAGANVAAANYHFGSKDALLRAVLSRRLDPLARSRLALLERAADRLGADALTAEHLLAAMLVPALRLASDPDGAAPDLDGMRFVGRAFSDPSPSITRFLRERYEAVSHRFLDAFARALPALPRPVLRLRLGFVLRAVAGLVAGPGLGGLAPPAATQAGGTADGTGDPGAAAASDLLAGLVGLMAGALTAPAGPAQRRRVDEILALSFPPGGAVPIAITPEREPSRAFERLEG